MSCLNCKPSQPDRGIGNAHQLTRHARCPAPRRSVHAFDSQCRTVNANHAHLRTGRHVGAAADAPLRVIDMQRADAVDQRLIQRELTPDVRMRSEEHTSELQSLMRISYAVFCLKKTKKTKSIYIHKP